MEIFVLSQLKKSKNLSFQKDIEEAESLALSGFYTSAFLRQWQVVEAVSRELIIITRSYDEAQNTWSGISKIFKKQTIDPVKNNLKLQIENVLFSSAKQKMESSFRYIDIGQLGKAFDSLGLSWDKLSVRYLMASSIKKENRPPGANESTTIREKRNQVIHRNLSLTKAQYDQYLPFFQQFFDIVRHQIFGGDI